MSDPHATHEGEIVPTPDSWPAPSSTAPRRVSRRARIWLTAAVGLLVVAIVASLIAARVSVDYYVITPGDASPVSQYISVPPADAHPITGKILLTDVFVSQLNALSYLRYRYLDTDNEIFSGSELLGGAPDQSQFLDQGYLEMAQAQTSATAAALRRLGYVVHATAAGTQVFGTAPGSPAAKTLKVAQVITAVDATPTLTACALVHALVGKTPGTNVSLTVVENSINGTGQVVPGPTVHKAVRLAAPPKGLTESGCGVTTPPTTYLGIDPRDQQEWDFPVKVTVHTQDIGGPSAGLAMTLGIIDKLSSGRLTGHRVVAATGTIDPEGNVGDVGGVAEKAVAVERAGATVFFVPKVELAAADSKAGSQLHVYGVDNLGQVMRILERLGGKVPANPVSAQAAP